MPKRTESIYQFNHIDKNLSQETIDEIKSLYSFYHKKWWCYLKAFKYFKRLNLFVNLTSASLIISGTIAGSVTLNPVILGTISGSGLLLKTLTELKNYSRKIEMSKFAYTTYQKTLVELRSGLRGKHFDHELFINDMKLIDEIIIDMCPAVVRFEKQYTKKYTA